MQVYFVASSRLVDENKEVYGRMYKTIAVEYKMVSDKVIKWIKKGVSDLQNADLETKIENYKETLKDLSKADIVVMEISGHSMSMGYIVSKTLELNKPVIALHTPDAQPIFIVGINNPKLILREYEPENMERVLWDSLKEAKSLIDMRFNFFVSPKILNYLDWVGRKRMIPKSVFLRNLIEREMKKDREFKG